MADAPTLERGRGNETDRFRPCGHGGFEVGVIYAKSYNEALEELSVAQGKLIMVEDAMAVATLIGDPGDYWLRNRIRDTLGSSYGEIRKPSTPPKRPSLWQRLLRRQ